MTTYYYIHNLCATEDYGYIYHNDAIQNLMLQMDKKITWEQVEYLADLDDQ